MKSKFRQERNLHLKCAGVIDDLGDADFELSPWNLTDTDLVQEAGKNIIKNESHKIETLLNRFKKGHKSIPKQRHTLYHKPLLSAKKENPISYDEFVQDRKDEKEIEDCSKLKKTLYEGKKKQDKRSLPTIPTLAKLPQTPLTVQKKLTQALQTIGLSPQKKAQKHNRTEKEIKPRNPTIYPKYMGLSEQRKAKHSRGHSLQPLYQVYLYYCRDRSNEPKRSHEDAIRTMFL